MKTKITLLMMLLLFTVATNSSAQTQNIQRGGESFVVDGLGYEAINFDPNEVTVSSVSGEIAAAFAIPETVSFQGVTFSVVQINSFAFEEIPITSITIPATIREIRSGAFELTNLTQVTALGTTAPVLESNAFDDRSVVSLTVPTGSEDAYLSNGWTGFATINGINPNFEVSNITYTINSQANSTVSIIDSSITGVGLTIPTTVTFNSITYTITEISANAFNGNQLTSVVIPSTVAGIGESAFENNQLMTVTIPNLVTTLGRRAFNTNQLTNVVFPPNLTEMGDRCFENNQLASINLPIGVTFLDFRVFHNNNFTSVTIPANITAIGLAAFTENSITTIEVLGTTPPSVTTISFDNENTIAVTVPIGTEAAYQAAGWDIFGSINGIIQFSVGAMFTENNFNYTVTSLNPNEVAITGGTAFPDDLIIDANVSSQGSTFTVTSVGVSAFEDGTLTSVQLPNTIRSIDNFAFQNNQIIGSLTIPNSVTRINFRAFRFNQIESVIIPNSVTILGNGVFEINALTSVTISENLTSIGNQTFRNNQLATVTIPANINSLGTNCFRDNPLTEVVVLNTAPPTLSNNDPFVNIRGNIALTVPANTELTYLTNDWTGFATINGQDAAVFNEFEVANITYKINKLNPNEVETVDTSLTGELTIPSTVNDGNEDYTITSIGNSSFRDKQLTSVTISNGITNIGVDAFRNNQLTSVVIPASVTNIGASAFRDTPLTTVIVEGFTPPTINSNTFSNRGTIDLFIPVGTSQAYTNAAWTGFNSTTETTFDIVIAPKVFLQGASLNPIAGEEALMRDDLRANNLIPLSSPYGDDATVAPTVFDTTGASAIVDWVFVELREGVDNENTTVVASKSALLQRDGDIVGLDGTSSITFTADEGGYFIAIRHRNHIGVLAAVPAALSSTASTLDFTQDAAFAKGENLALTTLVNGTFAMIAGDADGSSQILNTDINEGLSQAGGGQAYSTADADMNGFVLNTDVQLLILGNSGTVQQFD